jgi:hypothetical protein
MTIRSIARTTVGTAGTLAALAAIVYAAPGTPAQAAVTWHAPYSRSMPPQWLSWTAAFRAHGARCVYVKGGRGPRVGEVCSDGKAYAYTVHGSAPLPSAAPLPQWVMWAPLSHTRQILVWGGDGDTTLAVGPLNGTDTS